MIRSSAAEAVSLSVCGLRFPRTTLTRCHAGPLVDGAMCKAAPCMFTNTPDKHFILDLLPGNSKVPTLSQRA